MPELLSPTPKDTAEQARQAAIIKARELVDMLAAMDDDTPITGETNPTPELFNDPFSPQHYRLNRPQTILKRSLTENEIRDAFIKR